MAGDWHSRLSAMVESLEQDSRIEVRKAELSGGASAQEIAAAERAADGALPEPIKAFYRDVNGLTLEWRARGDLAKGTTVRGAVNLLPIARVFGDWQSAVAGLPLKPFDLFVAEACAALWWPKAAKDSTVRLHSFGEGTVDTHYHFAEYLERLLVSRGFWYWIQTLSTETNVNPEAEAFRKIAPQLFPDYQDALFQPR